MIDIDQLNDILGRWQHWVNRQGGNNHLGVKIGSYAERIGAGSYGDSFDIAEADVLELDKCINMMTDNSRAIIGLQYNDSRPVKAKTRYTSTQPYYAVLEHVKRDLLEIVNKVQVRRASTKERLHESE